MGKLTGWVNKSLIKEVDGSREAHVPSVFISLNL